MKDSYVYQGNLHVQQALGQGWAAGFGYNAEIGKRLPLGTGFAFQNDQFNPSATLQAWTANYRARNGTGNTGSDQVANPFQPNPNALIPFGGNLSKKTIPLGQILEPYPYLGYQPLIPQKGFSSYHASQASVKKDFRGGLLIGANFT